MDIFDFSDFFDFQADVPPKINDLRSLGFGLWFALVGARATHRPIGQVIHIERGEIHVCDLDDWLQAERELEEKYNKSKDGGPKKK